MDIDRRVSSGVPGLDASLEGGFPADRVIVVRGPIGTGKTTLALQFLMDGIAKGEPGLLVSVDSKPRHVVQDAARFGWDLQGASSLARLSILDASPYFTAARKNAVLDPRQVASDLTQQARSLKAARMAIDSVTSLLPPDGPTTAVRDFLRSLFFSLEDNLGCTVLLTAWDGPEGTSAAGQYAESLASGVLELSLIQVGSRFERRLLVRKMRGTATDLTERRFDIVSAQGIVVDGHP